jgi:ornithine carbamoyltransferase
MVADVAKRAGGSAEFFDSPADAVRDADVVYTDVWASMGQEDSYAQRKEAFSGYAVTADMMALAKPNAIFMHDLPAHRGEEVATEVIDGPQSVVFDQAENRLHAQKAILALVAGDHAL